MAHDEYVTLMASLPALGPLLAARRPPITRLRLEQRLRLLDPGHRAELDRLMGLMQWRRLPLAATDAAQVARARAVIPTLSRPALQTLARERMELRTVVAALRRRHAGQDAPPAGEAWGYGRWTGRLRRGWTAPHFGLERALPWLPAAKEALDRGDSPGLERILLSAVWDRAGALARHHHFDFEAVALYVARWSLVERWTRYDGRAAADRFRRLADAALASPAIADTALGDTAGAGAAGEAGR